MSTHQFSTTLNDVASPHYMYV